MYHDKRILEYLFTTACQDNLGQATSNLLLNRKLFFIELRKTLHLRDENNKFLGTQAFNESPNKAKGFCTRCRRFQFSWGSGKRYKSRKSHWERPVKKEGSKTSEAMVAPASSILTHIVLFYAEKKKKLVKYWKI